MGCGWRATRPIPRTGRWLADCAICATNPSPRRPFTRPWLVLIGTPGMKTTELSDEDTGYPGSRSNPRQKIGHVGSQSFFCLSNGSQSSS
uniref:Uncharacterized protein n=1 Tax=Setaria viridis TaxID=4556 RepID=A0A4U6TJR1_SETVI|nr:hypothetical protein SEVIR_9G504850v2 [Setaria viridis]